jgi:hypothetical protein
MTPRRNLLLIGLIEQFVISRGRVSRQRRNATEELGWRQTDVESWATEAKVQVPARFLGNRSKINFNGRHKKHLSVVFIIGSDDRCNPVICKNRSAWFRKAGAGLLTELQIPHES